MRVPYADGHGLSPALLNKILENCATVPEAGCWLWLGKTHYKEGYGSRHYRLNGKRFTTHLHREVWQAINGPIPEGLYVCHRCDTRSCLNPDHLYAGTPKQNVMDMVSRGRAGRPVRKMTAESAAIVKASDDPTRALADQFGVSYRAIQNIRRGITWK